MRRRPSRPVMVDGKRGNARGRKAELIVRVALQELRDNHITTDFRQRDGPGHDFFVTFPNRANTEYPLEVKSSLNETSIHRKKYDIPVVFVDGRFFEHLTNKRMNRLVKRAKEEIVWVMTEGEPYYRLIYF